MKHYLDNSSLTLTLLRKQPRRRYICQREAVREHRSYSKEQLQTMSTKWSLIVNYLPGIKGNPKTPPVSKEFRLWRPDSSTQSVCAWWVEHQTPVSARHWRLKTGYPSGLYHYKDHKVTTRESGWRIQHHSDACMPNPSLCSLQDMCIGVLMNRLPGVQEWSCAEEMRSHSDLCWSKASLSPRGTCTHSQEFLAQLTRARVIS